VQKFSVQITRKAESDISKIYQYIAQDNPTEASKWFDALEKQIASLDSLPLRCPIIPEASFLGTEYRQLLHGNYRTIFMVEKINVIIMRVIHGARLLDLWMFEK
jgi:plasmid stabilization system protein ParE